MIDAEREVQLIETQRTRNPAPAREERISKRLAERVGVRLLARGGQRYAEAIIEGLGDPGKAWMSCSTCKRPYVQEWAVREMGHAMNRAMGNPQVLMQIANLIGAEPEFAKLAVGAYREVEHLRTPEEMAEYGLSQLQAYWAPRGKRVVVLDGLEPGGAGVTAGAAPAAATIPGSLNGGTDAEENESA